MEYELIESVQVSQQIEKEDGSIDILFNLHTKVKGDLKDHIKETTVTINIENWLSKTGQEIKDESKIKCQAKFAQLFI